jgi:Rieske Fe-S protein
MERKTFIKNCGLACLSFLPMTSLLSSCVSSKSISVNIDKNNTVTLALSQFEIIKNGTSTFRNFLILHNDLLQYPICVYRISATNYSALLMRCSHQGAELTAYGDKLVCSAHGSEFDKIGQFQSAPADKALKSFPVIIGQTDIQILIQSV